MACPQNMLPRVTYYRTCRNLSTLIENGRVQENRCQVKLNCFKTRRLFWLPRVDFETCLGLIPFFVPQFLQSDDVKATTQTHVQSKSVAHLYLYISLVISTARRTARRFSHLPGDLELLIVCKPIHNVRLQISQGSHLFL